MHHLVSVRPIQYTYASLPNSLLFKSIAHDTGAKFAISTRSSCAELNSMIRARSGRVKKAESHKKTRSWEIKNAEIRVNAEISHACNTLTLTPRKPSNSSDWFDWILMDSVVCLHQPMILCMRLRCTQAQQLGAEMPLRWLKKKRKFLTFASIVFKLSVLWEPWIFPSLNCPEENGLSLPPLHALTEFTKTKFQCVSLQHTCTCVRQLVLPSLVSDGHVTRTGTRRVM